MNKKLYAILVAVTLACSMFYACGDDDNNDVKVDEVWKAFNDSIYEATSNNAEFSKRACLTGNGDIYYKAIDEFNIVLPPTTKITSGGTPYSNDSVLFRFEGWFYYKDTKGAIQKYIFDGTEVTNKTAGVASKAKGPIYSRIGTGKDDIIPISITSGMISTLQYMRVNDQVQICLPHQLAYGINSLSLKDLIGNSFAVPGYTTLFINIVLLKIYPINPGEFPGVNTGIK